MTDQEHAEKIKALAAELHNAVNDAANVGLQVDIEARTIQSLSIGSAKAVNIWLIEASVARPL